MLLGVMSNLAAHDTIWEIDDGDDYNLRVDCNNTTRVSLLAAPLRPNLDHSHDVRIHLCMLHMNRSIGIILHDLSTSLVDDSDKTSTQQQLSAIRILFFDSYEPRIWC